MAEDGTRGSTLTGVVVRDCNSHAFVPHFSFGITFRECISFNTVSDAYWWDRVSSNLSGSNNTSNYPYTNSKDIVYERCVAADVRGLNPDESYRLYWILPEPRYGPQGDWMRRHGHPGGRRNLWVHVAREQSRTAGASRTA